MRPLLFTLVLCVVFKRIFHHPDVWGYAPFLLSGLTCWDYIVTATKQGCHSFFQGESYIRQHPAPIAIYPLRTALTETFHFLVSMVVLLSLAFYCKGGCVKIEDAGASKFEEGKIVSKEAFEEERLRLEAEGKPLPTFVPPTPAADHILVLISLVPTILLMFVLVWSWAVLAGFANVYFLDTQHLCDVGFQILFYATPIIYPVTSLGEEPWWKLRWTVEHFNPLMPFLDLMREPILYERMPRLETYGMASLVVLLSAGLAALVCWRLQRRVIFQL